MVQELKEIVERLNAEPFNRDYTVIKFDSFEGIELVQILADVINLLEKGRNKFKLTEDNIENNASKMAEIITNLGYVHPVDLDNGSLERCITEKVKHSVHACLLFLLKDFDELQKKAYMAEFLGPVDVPQEFLNDPELYENFQRLKDLQSKFRSVHDEFESRKAGTRNINELRKVLRNDEEDKQRLQTQIAQKEAQTSGLEGFKAIFQVTSALRKEQEKEADLMERFRLIQEEQEELAARCGDAQARRNQLAQQLRSSQTEAILSIVQGENARSRDILAHLANQREAVEEATRDYQAILRTPAISAKQLQELRTRVAALEEECVLRDRQLRDKISFAPSLQPYVDRLRSQEAELAELREDLEATESRQQGIQQEVAQRENDFQRVKGFKFMSREQFSAFQSNVKESKGTFRSLSAQEKTLAAELAVLLRTEQVVTHQARQLQREIEAEEARRGVQGLQSTESRLEQVSSLKASSDLAKGQTLESLSDLVLQLEQQAKAKSLELKPLIAQRKALKEDLQSLKARLADHHAAQDRTRVALDRTARPLKEEVSALQGLLAQNESELLANQLRLQLADAGKRRIENERKCATGSARFSASAPTLAAALENKLTNEIEPQIATLKQKAAALSGNSKGRSAAAAGVLAGAAQKRNLEGVRRLLQVKAETLKPAGHQRQQSNDPLLGSTMQSAQLSGSINTDARRQQQPAQQQIGLNKFGGGNNRLIVEH